MASNRTIFFAELLSTIVVVTWVYCGATLVPNKILPLELFLILSGAMLYTCYNMLFTEKKEK